MKIDFLYAWTKNRDTQNEYMKSLGCHLSLPGFLRFLFFFLGKRTVKGKNHRKKD